MNISTFREPDRELPIVTERQVVVVGGRLYLETGLIKPGSPLVLEDGCVNIPQGPDFSWA